MKLVTKITNYHDITIPKWKNLLQNSKTATIFQTREYLSAWKEGFIKDEKEIFAIEVLENENLIGLGIFRKEGDKITFLGTDSIGRNKDLVTDFGDIVAQTNRENEVWDEIVRELRGIREVREIIFDYVRESSPSFSVLKEKGYKIEEMIDNNHPDVAPFINLPGSWEEYLGKLERKQRHELRRKLRRLESNGYKIYTSSSQVADISEFIRLHKASTIEKDGFMTLEMETFFNNLTKNLSISSYLDLQFMEIEGKNAATIISFIWNNEFWLYNSGFDRSYDHFAVGFLLKALSVKGAIEKGYKRYSFLRGNERYKYDLGAGDEKLYKITLSL